MTPKYHYFTRYFSIIRRRLLAVAAVVMCIPEIALAVTMGTVMCAAADIVTGEVAAGIATIGICSIGVGACFGRVSWPVALMVSAGIAGLFGAGTIAKNLGAGGVSCDTLDNYNYCKTHPGDPACQ